MKGRQGAGEEMSPRNSDLASKGTKIVLSNFDIFKNRISWSEDRTVFFWFFFFRS